VDTFVADELYVLGGGLNRAAVIDKPRDARAAHLAQHQLVLAHLQCVSLPFMVPGVNETQPLPNIGSQAFMVTPLPVPKLKRS
jgi:hypothetical protein